MDASSRLGMRSAMKREFGLTDHTILLGIRIRARKLHTDMFLG